MEPNTKMFNYNSQTNTLSIDYALFTQLLNTHRIKLDEPSDAYLDTEAAKLNSAAVLMVNAVDLNPNADWDANWFFSRNLEDALEKQEGVYSAELDKADMILKVVFNFGNAETTLQFNYAEGGAIPADAATRMVDEILAVKPENIYEIGGMPPLAPGTTSEEEEKLRAEARQRAIEHYRKNIVGDPVHVFFEGRKFNIGNTVVPDPNIGYLLTAIAQSVYNGLPPAFKQDDAYAKSYSGQIAGQVMQAISNNARVRENKNRPYVLTQADLNRFIEQTIKQPV